MLAEHAYVQIQNPVGDFQGEVRTDAQGRFVLPGAGAVAPGVLAGGAGPGRAEHEVEVGPADLEVQISLR